MTDDDVKVGILNFVAISLSLSDLETSLKIITYVVSIGYTCYLWYKQIKKNK